MKNKIIFSTLFAIFCFILLYGIYFQKSFIENIFSVEKGQSVFEISKNLENQELITNSFYFNIYVFLTGKQGNLQAGEYFFDSKQSVKDIAQKIFKGETIKEKTITVIEGWDIRDIAWYFENQGMFQAEEIMEVAGFPLIENDLQESFDEFDFLEDKPVNRNLEGYLFPDTYSIGKNDGVKKIIEKMLGNFEGKLDNELREEIQKQDKSVFDIIIMASLLEKEVRTYDDKETVSGILWKRLNSSVPLQVDATIIYITGKKTVSREETKIDSRYNTYKYLSLPFGPICNPGLDSIKAAIYPKESKYWYYLSNLEGETIFSSTLKEHNINKAKYLK